MQFSERNPEHSAQCASDVNALFVLMPELKDLLAENIPALCEVFTLQPLHAAPTSEVVRPAKEGAEGCSPETIALDDFASDSDDEELNATQPLAAVKSEVLAEAAIVVDQNGNKEGLNDETNRPNSSCTRSSSDVVPQSDPPSEPGDADDEVMEITMQVPFDSIPRGKEVVADFIKMFPQVRYEEDITPSSTHLVMMNSQERLCQKRSLRYVFAVARKCELLARSWLEDSIKAKELLPTTQYALAGETAEEEPGWIRARRTTEPLFNRMSFFLPKTFSHSQLLSHEKLKELITLCGGTCCDKPWELANYKKAYTIFMSQSKEWDVARRYEASMDGVPVLVVDWVLDSISEFRIKPIEPYKIQQKN
ncbi:hypothetical protein TELCIR_05174 [Teladorsagia circumcincta]|uniref:BRCT domain-containing protein n=1 Tax=Teladorsagia circumcincta TaxID=45464 RepID=A0A2G9UTN0_TELCI|nr:hypothetical protein TELCIR_05174 [Teladorsagia circumcincta]